MVIVEIINGPLIPFPSNDDRNQDGAELTFNGRVRDTEYEKAIDFNYLDMVNKAFNNFFFYYSETPLLVINTNEIDFVKKKGDLDQLIQKINSHKIGREYYNPLGS